MGDADIIPIGTRGRPGRGSGNQRPSAAARDLVGKPRKPDDAETAPEGAQIAAEGAQMATEGAETSAETTSNDEPGNANVAEQRLSVNTPEQGIPITDWINAGVSAAREVFGESWEPKLAEFLAFLRRRVNGEYEVDEFGFDAEITERFVMALLRPIANKWFRIEVRGLENIPAEGGALVVSNHSGTIPVDGLMTMVSLHDHTGRSLRPLGADLVFQLPIVGGLARKAGTTLACSEDAERMLRKGELVGVWPEGFKGIGKPYSERYKLQRFGRGGFVSAALRTGVPIIPLSVVGAEEIYPLVGNVPSLARLLGLPYIPITPFFPLLGPLGLVPLPSKWILEFGEPIRTDTYEGSAADDPMLVFDVTDQVRETIQQSLYKLLMDRGSVFG
ncbi:lysophospholipid acyltransferase family protein [Nocardioides sp. Bht2]|uniref:lysophospholipid acyltransferase family protein n=1 Tax=Nocardioides sp. Bht2 TaxID=3392297 RepID=UPI0039B5B1D5